MELNENIKENEHKIINEIVDECIRDYCYSNSLECRVEFGVFYPEVKKRFKKEIDRADLYLLRSLLRKKDWWQDNFFTKHGISNHVPYGFFTEHDVKTASTDWENNKPNIPDPFKSNKYQKCVNITIYNKDYYTILVPINRINPKKEDVRKLEIKTKIFGTDLPYQDYENCISHLKASLKRELNVLDIDCYEQRRKIGRYTKITISVNIRVLYE